MFNEERKTDMLLIFAITMMSIAVFFLIEIASSITLETVGHLGSFDNPEYTALGFSAFYFLASVGFVFSTKTSLDVKKEILIRSVPLFGIFYAISFFLVILGVGAIELSVILLFELIIAYMPISYSDILG